MIHIVWTHALGNSPRLRLCITHLIYSRCICSLHVTVFSRIMYSSCEFSYFFSFFLEDFPQRFESISYTIVPYMIEKMISYIDSKIEYFIPSCTYIYSREIACAAIRNLILLLHCPSTLSLVLVIK